MAIHCTTRRAVLGTAMGLTGSLLTDTGWAGTEARDAVPIGRAMPDVRMRGLNVPDRQLASFRGKPLIINVWASWCGPCVSEMGSLERMAWHELMSGVQIIGVSTDDYRDRALALVKRAGLSIPHYLDQGLELEQLLGAKMIPLTVLINSSGTVLERIQGARAWDAEPEVRKVAKAFQLGGRPAR